MFGFSIFFKLRTWLVLGVLAGLLYLAYLFVPAVREGAEEVRAGFRMASRSSSWTTSDDNAIRTFNLDQRPGAPPFLVHIPDAYLDRSLTRDGFDGGRVTVIVSYPGFKPQSANDPERKYSIRLRVDYAPNPEAHKEFYIKNYDLITQAPDEKIGNLYGYIRGRGPEYRAPGIFWRYIGSDKWYYLDKETNTYAEFDCIQAGDPENYYSCTSSFLIDDKYSVLTSLPGPMIRQTGEFIDGLRQFLNSLEVAP